MRNTRLRLKFTGGPAGPDHAVYRQEFCSTQADAQRAQAREDWKNALAAEDPKIAALNGKWALTKIENMLRWQARAAGTLHARIAAQETEAAFLEQFGTSGSAFIHGKLREYAESRLAKMENGAEPSDLIALDAEMRLLAQDAGLEMDGLAYMLNVLKVDPATQGFQVFAAWHARQAENPAHPEPHP